MAGIESLFTSIATWFGFVSSCVAGGGPACRPFLAFVALAVAAGAALALLIMAWRAFRHEQLQSPESVRARRHEPVVRVRARGPAAAISPAPAVQSRGWEVTA
jgi:hypothetical protein